MWSETEIQRAFRLAYNLHPDRLVAWEVTREALKIAVVAMRSQQSRPPAGRPYKQKLDASNLLRRSIFLASERWERDQESRHPKLVPRYKPDVEDLLVRHLKTIVLHSMDRQCVVAAVGIGCFVFSYRPCEIAAVSPDHFDSDNIRRVKGWLGGLFDSRFRDHMIVPMKSGKATEIVPTSRQMNFVSKALAELAPSTFKHPEACAPILTLLEDYFAADSVRTELERSHVILNPECGGWAQLVTEHNALCDCHPGRKLAEPEQSLYLPQFDDSTVQQRIDVLNDAELHTRDDRFAPEPLALVELRSLQ